MKRVSLILLFSFIATSLVTSIGCRMCNTCYPLGGLMGKEGQECTCGNCPAAPRVGSIIDAPQEIVDGNEVIDPSTLPAGNAPAGNAPDTTGVSESTQSSSPLPSSGS